MSQRQDPKYLISAVIGLFIATVVCYANSFGGVFVFDDIPCIVENDSNRTLQSAVSATPEEIPTGLHRRSVVRFSLAANHEFGRLNTLTYHAVNLAIHFIAGLVLFDLIRRICLLEKMPDQIREMALPISFVTALIWLVHPLQTESVTYIVQRLESMMGMFYLLTIYCLLRATQSEFAKTGYFFAIAFCWLGMSSKEVMFTAPLTVLLFDRVFLADSWKEVFAKRWFVYLCMFGSMGWLLYQVSTQTDAFAAKQDNDAFFKYSRVEYLRTQPLAILFYIKMTLLPLGQCIFHYWPPADSAFNLYLPAIIVVFFLAASVFLLWKKPMIGFLVVSFFLILSVTSSFKPLGMMVVEHRMYLPLAPLVLLLVLLSWLVISRLDRDTAQKVFIGLWVLIAIGLGTKTVIRNTVYYSEMAMWKDVVEKSPQNPKAHYGVAKLLTDQEKFADAIPYFKKSIELRPEYADAYLMLANVSRKTGNTEEAIANYRLAIQYNDQSSEAHNNLGALIVAKDPVQAEIHYKKAIDANPRNAGAYYNLGNIYLRKKQWNVAIKYYNLALRIDSKFEAALLNRQWAQVGLANQLKSQQR